MAEDTICDRCLGINEDHTVPCRATPEGAVPEGQGHVWRAGVEAAYLAMRRGSTRKLSSLYHIDGERIIFTRTGKPIPVDEPVFILRGSDHLGVTLLKIYREIMLADRGPDHRLDEVRGAAKAFNDYAGERPEAMTRSGLLYTAEQIRRKYERRLQSAMDRLSLQNRLKHEEQQKKREKDEVTPLVDISTINPADLPDPSGSVEVPDHSGVETFDELDLDFSVDLDVE